MKKLIYTIPLLVLIVWIIRLKCRSETYETSLAVPVVITDSVIAKNLLKKLNKTIDSFNLMKPVVQQAAKKLQYQDSLIESYEKKLAVATDSSEIKRIRIDLYEARAEIKRLCEPRSIYLYQHKNY